MTDDNLAWEYMRDHYKTLYFYNHAFREEVNWKAQTFTEMIHGNFWYTRGSTRMTVRREDYIKKQHEKGVKALESFLQSVKRERPALAAEERHRSAEASLKTMSREDERFYRMITQDLLRAHERVKLNWYEKNQAQLEGAGT